MKFSNSPRARRSAAPIVLGLIFSLANLAPQGALADRSSAKAAYRRAAIEGVWDSAVTLHVCATGAPIRTFRALNLFEEGGALVATSEVAQPPSLGEWRWVEGSRYEARFRFQRFDAAGALLGFTEVTRQIDMDAGRRSFSSVFTTRLIAPDGTVVGEGCGAEAAVRVF